MSVIPVASAYGYVTCIEASVFVKRIKVGDPKVY
jgi:hypothetical protein